MPEALFGIPELRRILAHNNLFTSLPSQVIRIYIYIYIYVCIYYIYIQFCIIYIYREREALFGIPELRRLLAHNNLFTSLPSQVISLLSLQVLEGP